MPRYDQTSGSAAARHSVPGFLSLKTDVAGPPPLSPASPPCVAELGDGLFVVRFRPAAAIAVVRAAGELDAYRLVQSVRGERRVDCDVEPLCVHGPREVLLSGLDFGAMRGAA